MKTIDRKIIRMQLIQNHFNIVNLSFIIYAFIYLLTILKISL